MPPSKTGNFLRPSAAWCRRSPPKFLIGQFVTTERSAGAWRLPIRPRIGPAVCSRLAPRSASRDAKAPALSRLANSCWDSIRPRWQRMRSSSASTFRVLMLPCAGVLSRWCGKAARLQIPLRSQFRTAVAVLAAAADRPCLLPAVAERIQAGEKSEDVLRGAIAQDVKDVTKGDSYLMRLHTSTVLRAVREVEAK